MATDLPAPLAAALDAYANAVVAEAETIILALDAETHRQSEFRLAAARAEVERRVGEVVEEARAAQLKTDCAAACYDCRREEPVVRTEKRIHGSYHWHHGLPGVPEYRVPCGADALREAAWEAARPVRGEGEGDG